MKTDYSFKSTLFTAIFSIFIFMLSSFTAWAQSGAGKRSVAAPGDTVWVIVEHVKADKRTDYEHFVHDIFWAASKKLSPSAQRAFKQTRVLHPARAQKDGTYTYAYMMDPVIAGGNYDIESLLKQEYGEQKAAEYYKMYNETLAGTQDFYSLIQSKD